MYGGNVTYYLYDSTNCVSPIDLETVAVGEDRFVPPSSQLIMSNQSISYSAVWSVFPHIHSSCEVLYVR